MLKSASRTSPRQWGDWMLRPSGPLPRPSRRGYAFDVALVAVLVVISAAYFDDRIPERNFNGEALSFQLSEWIAPVGFLLVTMAALVWRRRFPLTVLWIVTLATVLLEPDMPQLAFYVCVIAGYSAAAYSPFQIPTMASLAIAVIAVASLSPNVLQDVQGSPGSSTITESELNKLKELDSAAITESQLDGLRENMEVQEKARGGNNLVPSEFVPSLILIPIVLAASAMRVWKNRVTESRGALSRLEQERAEELRRAAEQERSRIARELHDVVTHNVSVMVIQTGAARKVMDTSPEQAKEALLAVETGGRAAMSELRHVMGLLTMDNSGAAPDAGGDTDGLDLTPQPSLERLEALVARVRDSGTDIELTITGQARPLPSGIELAAYRVVQEALTNTVKHAAGATARVSIDYGPTRLRVRVTDTGGTATPAAATGNGRGLLGLRERLAVYGGTLRSGPSPLGGYRVEAVVPLEETP